MCTFVETALNSIENKISSIKTLKISYHFITMKFFSWMQSKFSARDGEKRGINADQKSVSPNIVHWRDGLLAIGTLGCNDHTFENATPELVERSLDSREEEDSSPDFSEFTTEEVRSLQKELTKLLRQKSGSKVDDDRPLDKFLNYPSSLDQVDLDSDEGDIDRTIRIILGRCKDASEKKMARKSLCFLIKKLFACTSGFHSTPSFRPTFQESRMEKLMRAMLEKKIHHQKSYEASPTKKCIEEERSNNSGFKWDKSDSEFIVLDI